MVSARVLSGARPRRRITAPGRAELDMVLIRIDSGNGGGAGPAGRRARIWYPVQGNGERGERE
eukprot:750332-Hanusia_phi.AAC.5